MFLRVYLICVRALTDRRMDGRTDATKRIISPASWSIKSMSSQGALTKGPFYLFIASLQLNIMACMWEIHAWSRWIWRVVALKQEYWSYRKQKHKIGHSDIMYACQHSQAERKKHRSRQSMALLQGYMLHLFLISYIHLTSCSSMIIHCTMPDQTI